MKARICDILYEGTDYIGGREMVKKLVWLFSMLVFAITMSKQDVNAELIEMSDGNMFDAHYYAESNPDVKNTFGENLELLYQHYQLYGVNEGRNAIIQRKNYNIIIPEYGINMTFPTSGGTFSVDLKNPYAFEAADRIVDAVYNVCREQLIVERIIVEHDASYESELFLLDGIMTPKVIYTREPVSQSFRESIQIVNGEVYCGTPPAPSAIMRDGVLEVNVPNIKNVLTFVYPRLAVYNGKYGVDSVYESPELMNFVDVKKGIADGTIAYGDYPRLMPDSFGELGFIEKNMIHLYKTKDGIREY